MPSPRACSPRRVPSSDRVVLPVDRCSDDDVLDSLPNDVFDPRLDPLLDPLLERCEPLDEDPPSFVREGDPLRLRVRVEDASDPFEDDEVFCARARVRVSEDADATADSATAAVLVRSRVRVRVRGASSDVVAAFFVPWLLEDVGRDARSLVRLARFLDRPSLLAVGRLDDEELRPEVPFEDDEALPR